jgi:hypothetical protein
MLLDEGEKGKPFGAAKPSVVGAFSFLKGYIAVMNGSDPHPMRKLQNFFGGFLDGARG